MRIKNLNILFSVIPDVKAGLRPKEKSPDVNHQMSIIEPQTNHRYQEICYLLINVWQNLTTLLKLKLDNISETEQTLEAFKK